MNTFFIHDHRHDFNPLYMAYVRDFLYLIVLFCNINFNLNNNDVNNNYRIVIETEKSGKKWYIAQKKKCYLLLPFMVFWEDITVNRHAIISQLYRHDNIEDTKKAIDNYRECIENREQKEIKSKTIYKETP